MLRKVSFVVIVAFILGGCTSSIPMKSIKESNQAKQFNPPSNGKAGLYIYRESFLGKIYKYDIRVDGKCIGESANDVFFYVEVAGNKEHTISTESEFSPNALTLKTKAGNIYFVEQQVKLGFTVEGAKLKIVNNTKGMAVVSKLGLAKKGTCSK